MGGRFFRALDLNVVAAVILLLSSPYMSSFIFCGAKAGETEGMAGLTSLFPFGDWMS